MNVIEQLFRFFGRWMGRAARRRQRQGLPLPAREARVGEIPLRPPRWRDLRDQLDANEFFEAEQSRDRRRIEIAPLRERTTTQTTSRRLTATGFQTEQDQTFLQDGAGRIIREEDLYGGGQCWVCGEYADRQHFLHCAICQRGICPSHGYPYEGFVFCPVHAKQALWITDTWNANRNGEG